MAYMMKNDGWLDLQPVFTRGLGVSKCLRRLGAGLFPITQDTTSRHACG